MNSLQRYHAALKTRQGRARRLRALLKSVGVTVPVRYGEYDMTRKTYAVTTLQSLVDKYGVDNVRLALRLLVETNDENARCIVGSAITALTIIVVRHDYGGLGLVLFDAMDYVNVQRQIEIARHLKRPGDDEAAILVGLIASELKHNLGEFA